jgi:membrane protein YqaA with SNARE-associated domain
MNEILQGLAHFFFSLGGLGLLLLGTLDSSFLMLPLGNDLLLVALTASRSEHLLYYVLMATAGSIAGVALAHWVSSRTGKKAIEGENKSRQVAYVERQMKKYGGLAIGVAALAPPGFPFTAFIVVPAALQYPLKRMLAIIAACRLVRFLVEGWLALVYGRRILEMAKSPVLQRFLIALIAISIIGSVISIRGWIEKGRTRRRA